MQYAGIVVVTRGERVAEVAARLESLAGAEVYVRDEVAGRLVVVQEAMDVEAHEALFRRIQALPGVLSAELVCHVDDPDPLPIPPSGSDPARITRDGRIAEAR